MIDFDSGDIVLVHFPFTDLSSTKQRPAVIVNHDEYPRQYGDFVLMPLTSQPPANLRLELLHWREAGLLRKTWVKPIIATVQSRLVIKVIGAVAIADHPVIRDALDEIFAERWFVRNKRS